MVSRHEDLLARSLIPFAQSQTPFSCLKEAQERCVDQLLGGYISQDPKLLESADEKSNSMLIELDDKEMIT